MEQEILNILKNRDDEEERAFNYFVEHSYIELPKDVVEKIEQLYKVSSFDDIEKNITLSLEMLDLFDKKFNNFSLFG